jgi:hypothetical protein
MQNRLYVGNLAGDVAASSLEELFESHGFVMDVKLIGGDETGQPWVRFRYDGDG